MTLKEVLAAVDGRIIFPTDMGETDRQAALDTEICGAVTDNRKIEKNGIFVPVVGAKVDGHSFIAAAYKAGAIACLNEQTPQDVDGVQIMVENTLTALKKLAAAYRRTLSIPIVGIVGSVGKTSSKEMVASVLSQHFCVLKTAGNLNNEIGLPLTLMSIRQEHEIAVVEMGISDFGEMDRLGQMAMPDVVVMTNIGQCHLEFLHDRDGILNAKTEVFAHLNHRAMLILNGDDDKLFEIRHGVPTGSWHRVPDDCTIEYYGINDPDFCDIHAENTIDNGLNGIRTTLVLGHGAEERKIDAAIPIPGLHNVSNAMAAALVADHFGLSGEEISAGIAASETISGRSHLIRIGQVTLMDDCYNASPTSMKASLKVLSTAAGRKIAVLGDMGELGENERFLHYDVGKTFASMDIDALWTTGPLSEEICRGAAENIDPKRQAAAGKCDIRHFGTAEELETELASYIKKGDTILIKASHFMNYSKIVTYISDFLQASLG